MTTSSAVTPPRARPGRFDSLEQEVFLNLWRTYDRVKSLEEPQGVELLDEIHEAVQECHRRQLGHLGTKSLRSLAKLLKAARQPHEDAGNLSFVDE